MKRFFIFFIVALALVLEISFLTNFKIAGVIPNIFLMLILASLFLLPEKYTFYMAFWGSLILGFFSNTFYGSESLAIMLVLLVLILSHNYIFTNINYLLLIFFAFSSTILYNFFLYFLTLWSGYKTDLLFFIQESAFPLIIINIILAVLWYFFLGRAWDNLSRREERARLLG